MSRLRGLVGDAAEAHRRPLLGLLVILRRRAAPLRWRELELGDSQRLEQAPGRVGVDCGEEEGHAPPAQITFAPRLVDRVELRVRVQVVDALDVADEKRAARSLLAVKGLAQQLSGRSGRACS